MSKLLSLAFLPIVSLFTLATPLTTAIQAAIASPDEFPNRVVCQAVIPLAGGDSLIYQVVGSFSPNPKVMPQNLPGSTMTVHRRKGNSRPQIVLRPASMNNYESIAPDGDYSKLPFTGTFQGQPNNGKRLYGVRGSVHGLYVSLRPTDGYPQRMQVLHYLSADNFIRSGNGTGSCSRQ